MTFTTIFTSLNSINNGQQVKGKQAKIVDVREFSKSHCKCSEIIVENARQTQQVPEEKR